MRSAIVAACGERPERAFGATAPPCHDVQRDHDGALRLAGIGLDAQNVCVSAAEIDAYLNALDEPKRTTLSRLREAILTVMPDAEQGISYGVPAFKVNGKTIAGFAAFKNHLSYLPHSGSVFPELSEELTGYSISTGALRFQIDSPLPQALLEKLITVRLRQAFPE
jgi:uncharacterized protein YdhG (YjbR/CyaY superfamily)